MTPPDPPPPEPTAPALTVSVDVAHAPYDILIGPALLPRAGELIRSYLKRPRAIVVTDETVAGLYQPVLARALTEAGIESHFVVLPPGEQTKSFAHLERLLDQVLAHGLERTDHLIALGGGVIGDLTGFAAAVALRGVSFIQIPTTLLAQVDSSVGGKTGIDTGHGKNTVGAFHQPSLVLCDISVLTTLPERQMRAGYAEIVKYAVLGDVSFLSWLETHGKSILAGDEKQTAEAVAICCRMKADIVAEDEREKGRRALLNLGHTFGHALEAETGFSESLLHGEAVSIGMVWAAELSARLGRISEEDVARVRRHLVETGLPTGPEDRALGGLSPDRLVSHMEKDKKVEDGRLTFVLLQALGEADLCRTIDRPTALNFLEDQLS